MSEKKKFEKNQPGMDQKRDVDNDNYEHTREAAQSGKQGRASHAAGSTTQGGSNFGQGSHQLAGSAYHQGSEKNRGASYENEQGDLGEEGVTEKEDDPDPEKQEKANGSVKGKLSEKRDDIPHGQGAHVNEKESNAQEDYPGTGPSTGSNAKPSPDNKNL